MRSNKEHKGARMGQEEPGGAPRGQGEELGGTKKKPGAPRRSYEDPGRAVASGPGLLHLHRFVFCVRSVANTLKMVME